MGASFFNSYVEEEFTQMRSYLESLYTNSSSLGSKMEIGLDFACVVTAFTALVMSGILTAQFTVPVAAQGAGSGSDPASLLQSAKMHLFQALKELKTGNSQAALTELNMTNQGINSAEARLNASVICNNVNNEGFCEEPPGAGG